MPVETFMSNLHEDLTDVLQGLVKYTVAESNWSPIEFAYRAGLSQPLAERLLVTPDRWDLFQTVTIASRLGIRMTDIANAVSEYRS